MEAQAAAAAAASEESRAGAEVEVQMQQFPHAVMYHQAELPRDAAGALPAGTSPAAASSGRLVVIIDPEVTASQSYSKAACELNVTFLSVLENFDRHMTRPRGS